MKKDTPFEKQIGTVGDGQRFVDIMVGDENANIAVFQFPDNLLNVFHCDGVDTGKRLVEHDETGLDGKTTGDFASTTFATTQLVAFVLAHPAQAELADKALKLLQLIITWLACHLQYGEDVVLDTHLSKYRCLLGQIAYACTSTLVDRVGGHLLVAQVDMTAIGYNQSRRHVERSGLSSTIWPQQSHNLTLGNESDIFVCKGKKNSQNLFTFAHNFINRKQKMLIYNWLTAFGRYIILMGRTFSIPERFRMFWKQYIKEMAQLGVNSIGIVLLISFFIGAVICIQMKLNIESPWMPRWVAGYTTREIMLLEFSSSIMCLILSGKVGSNIASEIGTMRVTQQIDALDIMGVNSACYLILPKIIGMITIMPFLVVFSSVMGIIGAYGTAYIGHIMPPDDLTAGLQHDFQSWFVWMSIIKSLFFAFIISSVPSYFGYTVEGGSVNVGKASTDAVVTSSALILFSDVFLTQLLS